MWIVDRTESAQRLYFVTNTGAVFTAPQIGSSFTPWCTPHADLAPRQRHHTHASHRAPRSRGARVGATGRCSPSCFSARRLAVGLQAPTEVSRFRNRELYRCAYRALRGVIAYTEHADAQSYTEEDEQIRRGHYLGRGVSETIHIDRYIIITAVSVTCVRWTARMTAGLTARV